MYYDEDDEDHDWECYPNNLPREYKEDDDEDDDDDDNSDTSSSSENSSTNYTTYDIDSWK